MNRTRKITLRRTRPATKVFSSLCSLRWLTIAGIFLLLAPRALGGKIMNRSCKISARRGANSCGHGLEQLRGTGAAIPSRKTSRKKKREGFAAAAMAVPSRFPVARGSRWLTLAGVFLLLVPRALASFEIIGGEGEIGASTLLCTTFQCLPTPDCEAGDGAFFAAPVNNPSDPPATSVHVSQCSAGGSSVGPVDLQGAYTGDAQSMNLTTSGSGSGHADSSHAPPSFQVFGDSGSNIFFTVSGEATEVAIAVSMTASNCSLAKASLLMNGVLLGEITADNNGQHGSFPAGPLAPGNYFIELEFSGGSPPFSFSGTVSVGASTPTPIQWNNPAGGSFQTAANWDPQMVPGTNDTAIFGLASAYSVNVGTATTERLEIRNGDVTFSNANYTVAATDFDPAGILLDNSILRLSGGSALLGVHTLIGDQAAARIDVSSAALNLSGSLRVGGPGNGILDVTDGGLVLSGEGRIGTGEGGGTAMLSGVNSTWSSGNLSVGYTANGTLSISDGSNVISEMGFVGFGAGAAGTVTIEGSGPDLLAQPSLWKVNNSLTIGQDGTGTVQVLDFGVLDVHAKTTVNGILFVADGALSSHNSKAVTIGGGHQGDVTVTGYAQGLPARMNAISDLTLGQSATGNLTLDEGGLVACTNATMAVGADGTAVVSGFNQEVSTLAVSSQLVVGQSHLGRLTVSEGGFVSAQDLTAGSAAGALGIVEVLGKSTNGPSLLLASANVILGLEGTGSLVIGENAVVSCSSAALGVFAGSEGIARLGVDNAPGSAAQWLVDGDMMIGGLAPGERRAPQRCEYQCHSDAVYPGQWIDRGQRYLHRANSHQRRRQQRARELGRQPNDCKRL